MMQTEGIAMWTEVSNSLRVSFYRSNPDCAFIEESRPVKQAKKK